MATREEMIAEIQRLEEIQAIEAELGRRKQPLGEKLVSKIQEKTGGLGNVAGFAKESAKNLGVGTLKAADAALQGHPILGPILNAVGLASTGKTPRQAIDALPVEDMGLWGKTMQGAGGGVLGAPSAATILPAMAAGGMAAIGGDAGGTAAEKSGLPRGVGEVPGALLAGGATGFATGPKQTVGKADIRRALSDSTPETWRNAAQKVDDFAEVGAKTATLGEAFPQTSAIQDLTRAARGGNLDNAVKTRTVNRVEDLQQLGTTFLDRVGPAVKGNAVAERVAQAANAVEKGLAELKNTAFRNRLGDEAIRPDRVKSLEDALLSAAQQEVRGGPKAAYREIAAGLRNPDTGELITQTSELSKVLYGLQTALKDGAVLGKAGNSIQANDMAIPLKNAKKGLEELSPRFAAANTEARLFNQGPRTEFAQSPVKALADRNPAVVDPTPISRLNRLLSGTDAEDVTKAARTLERDPILQPGQGVGPLEIARALAQEKLKGLPSDPGAAVRQSAGSPMEAQIAALLAAGGKDPKQVLKPLQVADDLQGLTNPAGMKELPRMSPWQMLLRPFRTADMAITGQGLKGIEKEIADLLANPTPEALQKLREIAMFDPNLRRQLSTLVPALGLAGSSGGAVSQEK